jgi:hypothetical protein
MLHPEDEFDGRVRDWLEPDLATVERVKARVLSTPPEGRRFARRAALLGLAGLLVGVGGFWLWRSTAPVASAYTATFEGDVLVVRAPDGRCWISSAPSSDLPPAGAWRIIYQGER